MDIEIRETNGNIRVIIPAYIAKEFTAEEISTYIYNQVKGRVSKWQAGNQTTTE